MSSKGAWTATVTTNAGDDIILVKVAKDAAPNRWSAQKIMNALRAKLPLRCIATDMVVIDGEGADTLRLFGSSSEAETYARGIAASFPSLRWSFVPLA